jgi:malate dehydrogenase (oxaloacetate-decarboxylating)(NADP+)
MTKQPTAAENKRAELRSAALDYHEFPTPGKVAVAATKQLTNQRDLALAYSPGVAAPCEEIVADPANAFRYTSRGNLVGVITNGTAVLGLGDIGPLASWKARGFCSKSSRGSMSLTSKSMSAIPRS